MPPAKIRAAVWEVDEAVLDVDQLAMVSRMLPTHDEVRLPGICWGMLTRRRRS
jgi:hypothetical protein